MRLRGVHQRMYRRLRRTVAAVVAAAIVAAVGDVAARQVLAPPFPLVVALALVVPVLALVSQTVRVGDYLAGASKSRLGLALDALGGALASLVVALTVALTAHQAAVPVPVTVAVATLLGWVVGYAVLWHRAPTPRWTTA